MRAVAAAVVFGVILYSTPAAAYTCEQIKAWHKQYGTVWLLQKAREYKLTATQIRAAIACLRSR